MRSSYAITKLQVIVMIVVIAVAAIVGGYYYYLMATPTQEVGEIKVGYLCPYSGPAAFYAPETGGGFDYAVELVNSEGGVLGKYPIRVVYGDTEGNPAKGAAEAERLITVEGVKIIMGVTSSSVALAVQEICEKYKVVFWDTTDVSDKITERNMNYTFRCCATGMAMGYTGVKFIKEKVCPALNIPTNEIKIAIIHEDGAYGTSVKDGTVKAATEEGMKIVLVEGYSSKATDLSYLIMKLIAANPDVLCHTAYPSDAILWFKQARELGFKCKVLMGFGGGHGLPSTPAAIGVDFDYVFNVDAMPSAAGLNPDAFPPETAARLKKFVSDWKKKYGREPWAHANYAYADALVFFKEVLPLAITKYGSADPDDIVKAAREIDVPEGKYELIYGYKFSSPENPWYAPFDPTAPRIGENIKSFAIVNQWIGMKQWVIWPYKYATADPVIPLPSGHTFAP